MTWEARLASSTMSDRVSTTPGREARPASTSRRVACAFATIAASGWLISWASDAASSPSVVVRST